MQSVERAKETGLTALTKYSCTNIHLSPPSAHSVLHNRIGLEGWTLIDWVLCSNCLCEQDETYLCFTSPSSHQWFTLSFLNISPNSWLSYGVLHNYPGALLQKFLGPGLVALKMFDVFARNQKIAHDPCFHLEILIMCCQFVWRSLPFQIQIKFASLQKSI